MNEYEITTHVQVIYIKFRAVGQSVTLRCEGVRNKNNAASAIRSIIPLGGIAKSQHPGECSSIRRTHQHLSCIDLRIKNGLTSSEVRITVPQTVYAR